MGNENSEFAVIRWTEVIRIITAVFLRETLEAANNDAEMMVQERLLQNARYVKKLEGILTAAGTPSGNQQLQ